MKSKRTKKLKIPKERRKVAKGIKQQKKFMLRHRKM